MAGALAEFKKYLLSNDYPEIKSDYMKIYLVQSGGRVLPTMSERILSGVIVWTAGVTGNAVDGFNPGSIVAGNRIAVNEYRQVSGISDVFAIGDIAFKQTPSFPAGHKCAGYPFYGSLWCL